MFVTDDRILETELHVFLILKDLSAKVGSSINKCDFWFSVMKYAIFVDLCNSMNHHFSNDQCIIML